MRNKTCFFLLLSFSFLFVHFNVTSVTAIETSYQQFRFYVSEPVILDYEDMEFKVRNTGYEPVRVNCTFKPIEGINVSVSMEWETAILLAGETKYDRYVIHVNETYASSFIISISVAGYSLDNNTDGSRVIGGVTVVNEITYFSGDRGHRLDLSLRDQSGRPRISEVIMYHRLGEAMQWTPIKVFNGSHIDVYLPEGYYQVLARDNLTGITADTIFYLDDDAVKVLLLELVGIRLDQPVFAGSSMGVNATINNYVETLFDVEIYAELYLDEELLAVTNKDRRAVFDKSIGYEITLWFAPREWVTGNYTVKGNLYSMGEHIAYYPFRFELTVKDEQEEGFDMFTGLIAGFLLAVTATIVAPRLNGKRKSMRGDNGDEM